VSFPYFISPEQAMRERSELARKGIARGRSVVVLAYDSGVLFVAENPSRSLQKVSELYDRVGFAAVGRFNEFDNLRRGGIQFADTRGYAYDRRDVTGRQLANVYAQTLGTIFTEQAKPYEVELCVAEVGVDGAPNAMYHVVFDGNVFDRKGFLAMGGQSDELNTELQRAYDEDMELDAALQLAMRVLRQAAPAGETGNSRLEVALLERDRPRRSFRRLTQEDVESRAGEPAS
jgi:proteasome alpha subunit